MKLFGKRSGRRPSGLTVIDERLTVQGNIETEGTVRVDGRVDGDSHQVGTLIIGPRGFVSGDIHATEIVVAGRLAGNIDATGRVEIEPGAIIAGDIRAAALVVRDGAHITGRFQVAESPAEADNDEGRMIFPTPSSARHAAA